VAILLGLAAGLIYGTADFIGGLATKRAPLLTVVLLSQVFGAGVLLLILPLVAPVPMLGSDVAWGASAGVAGALGVAWLYRGLARGRMSVVAPTSAVIGALIPLFFGLLSGERPGLLALTGAAVALASVVLVSSSSSDQPGSATRRASGALDGAIAGLGFGFFFIFLANTSANAGLWPIAGARVSSMGVIAAVVVVGRRWRPPPSGVVPGIAAAGTLDVVSNVLYLVATRSGLLSLVAVVTSLYPASTVALARLVLKERVTNLQLTGVAGAIAGVALIAGG
jgi:drug/metabolite transporter (DMT)-like permease